MRIGIISDTHNQHYPLRPALKQLRRRGIGTLLHAGDVTNVATLELLRPFDTWIARGNMDRDPGLLQAAAEFFGPQRMQMTHDLHINGTRLALLHGDAWQTLHDLISSQEYAYVIHGHTHIPKDDRVNATRVINPGAMGNTRWYSATCAILDLSTGDMEWLEF